MTRVPIGNSQGIPPVSSFGLVKIKVGAKFNRFLRVSTIQLLLRLQILLVEQADPLDDSVNQIQWDFMVYHLEEAPLLGSGDHLFGYLCTISALKIYDRDSELIITRRQRELIRGRNQTAESPQR